MYNLLIAIITTLEGAASSSKFGPKESNRQRAFTSRKNDNLQIYGASLS